MANEKRLIDANALISAIDEYMKIAYDCPLDEVADFQNSTNNIKLIYAVEGLYEATEIIDEAPTADAVEVVRGRWEDYAEGGKQCTACSRVFWHGEYNPIEPNYCPNCGAKMGL